MINALFSSKQGGTKQFKQGKGTEFGWKAITERAATSPQRSGEDGTQIKREAHCLRDSWAKLNELPAKIMQVILRLYL